jgi:hypothetical protein
VQALPREAIRSGTQLVVPLRSKALPGEVGPAYRVLAGAGQLEAAAEDTLVRVPANGTTVVSSSAARKAAANSDITPGEKTPMPWLVVDTKSAAPDAQLRIARPYIGLVRAVYWEEATQAHIAEFQIGLDAEEGAAGPLEVPVTAALSVSCDEVRPVRLTLDTMGPDGQHYVRVRCSRSAAKAPLTQFLNVRLAEGELSYAFSIPRDAVDLQLSSSATTAAGFGIGTVFLTVKHVLRDGTPVAVDTDTPVRFETESAAIDPSGIVLGSGTAESTVEVRARDLGTVRIRAKTGGLTTPPIDVTFKVPVVYLLTTLLCGGIGGYLSATRTRRRRGHFIQRLLEGSIVGTLIVTGLLVIPSSDLLPEWTRSNVVGWSVTSALAGFIGSELIEKLAHRVFGKTGDEPQSTKPV